MSTIIPTSNISLSATGVQLIQTLRTSKSSLHHSITARAATVALALLTVADGALHLVLAAIKLPLATAKIMVDRVTKCGMPDAVGFREIGRHLFKTAQCIRVAALNTGWFVLKPDDVAAKYAQRGLCNRPTAMQIWRQRLWKPVQFLQANPKMALCAASLVVAGALVYQYGLPSLSSPPATEPQNELGRGDSGQPVNPPAKDPVAGPESILSSRVKELTQNPVAQATGWSAISLILISTIACCMFRGKGKKGADAGDADTSVNNRAAADPGIAQECPQLEVPVPGAGDPTQDKPPEAPPLDPYAPPAPPLDPYAPKLNNAQVNTNGESEVQKTCQERRAARIAAEQNGKAVAPAQHLPTPRRIFYVIPANINPGNLRPSKAHKVGCAPNIKSDTSPPNNPWAGVVLKRRARQINSEQPRN